MQRLTVSRFLDAAGLLLVGIALYLYFTGDKNPPVEGGMAGAIGAGGHQAFLYLVQWGSAIIGLIFLLNRALLRFNWRYIWMLLAAAGTILLLVFYNSVNTSTLNGEKRMPVELEIMCELAGFACIFFAFVLFVAQWLIHRGERNQTN